MPLFQWNIGLIWCHPAAALYLPYEVFHFIQLGMQVYATNGSNSQTISRFIDHAAVSKCRTHPDLSYQPDNWQSAQKGLQKDRP